MIINNDLHNSLASSVRSKINSERIHSDERSASITHENKNDKTLKLVDSFLELQNDVRWPLPFSLSSSIISTYGQVMTGNNMNKGIDITGFEEDPVNAVYHGVINRIGKNEVIIEHRFKHCSKIWYSVYSNVNTYMNKGDQIQAGQEIGQLTSSSGEQPFLHFEVVVDSQNIHPLLLSKTIDGPEFDRPGINIIQDISPVIDGIIEISIPSSQPNLNRFEVQVIGKYEQLKKNYIINLNSGTEFTMDKSTPYLSSVEKHLDYDYEKEMTLLKTRLVIPASWLCHKERYDWFRLVVDNIWGKKTYYSFTSEQTSW